ncbi:ferritin-like domain-containing protein [Coprinopsis sp. MPI-PUGE-AT-0042]|nr:ferritin-like domain-containing protein [Coprinopsis sp. MPI-PUGE-AT-0042]
MHFLKTSTLLAIVAASVPHLVSAAPAVAPPAVKKRAAEDILVFTRVAFYEQAIAKFQEADFVSAGFSSANLAVEQFVNIQKDESTHSVVLQAALKSFGEEPITSCKFNFAPALTDVATMAATARVVENVGVAAYLGGATLLTDPVLLTAAGSILTVEARHQTVLNILSGTGTAIPNAFDFALTPSEVLALAGPFFDGPCDLVTNTGAIGPGTKLTFSSSAITDQPNLHCQMLVGGKATAIPFPINDCVVPSDINGPVAIFVTSDAQPLLNNVRDRATTQLVAGPALAFIDIQPQTIATSTISPSQASGVVAGATGAGAPAPTGSAVVTLSASANLVTGPSQDGAITVNAGPSPKRS